MEAREILEATAPHPDSPDAAAFRAELLEHLAEAIAQRDAADRLATALMAKGRTIVPAVPLAELARAAGMSESGISVRTARARAGHTQH